MKFRWIRYIAERLPKEIRERRKTEIEACFTGTKKQLEEKVMESLYEQVKIVVVATAIFLMILLLTIVMYLSQDRRILITRDETGGETTEEQIRIKTKKDDDIYSLTIRPKGYTKSQITDALDRGEKYLKEHLVAKNKSINEVSKHLEMPSKIQGENITVQWQSDDPAVIDEEGNVFSKNVKKDYIVNLNARMECQGEVRILKIPVCVVPGNSGKRVSEKQKIIADLKKLEEKYITKEQFYLPDVIRQGRLLPADNESQIPAILFLGIVVIVFLWYHENEKYKEQKLQLNIGDKIFQYTDGVTEATDKDRQLYGMDRLDHVLNQQCLSSNPEETLKLVKADIDAFVGDNDQFDDITMLCLEYTKKMENQRLLNNC